MAKRMTNWDRLKNREPDETMQYRDVYEDQQLERNKREAPKTMTTRIIADIAMTIFMFFMIWLLISFFQWMVYVIHGGEVANGNFANVDGVMLSFGYFLRPTVGKVLMDITFSAVFYWVMYLILAHNLKAQNQLYDTASINEYYNDQHVALPAEIQRKFDWFPDVGATSDVQFSSMISHQAISNKGLKTVMVAQRATEDILDEDGEIITYKGEVLHDEDGNVLFEEKPLVDIEFMHALYDASGLPRSKNLRKFYSTPLIRYNPDGSDREKLGKFDTVADLINQDWELPWYEPQRPAGAYLVDTAPVNTMVFVYVRFFLNRTYVGLLV